MGKGVHQRYSDPSIKIYLIELTRAKMSKKLLVVKGRSDQPWGCTVPAGPEPQSRDVSWWSDEPCPSGEGTQPGSPHRISGGWDKAVLLWERRGWARERQRQLTVKCSQPA